MRPWLEPQDTPIPEALASAIGGHPLVAKVLVQRGITSPATAQAFFDPAHYQPTPPSELPGLAEAAAHLGEAIRHKIPMCVWGDFDVDGQTATTLLVSTLRDLGANVIYHIPIRETESHGVNLPALEQMITQGARLILTCDTGISAHNAVSFAKKRGVEVIITDHHDLPPELPEAFAIVNPKLITAQGHPLSTLPGVGVAYKLAEELYCQAGRKQTIAQYLDLAALGIVADLAIQTGEARYLLQRGLAALRETHRLGLKMMMELADLNPAWITETHIGFVLGPRLNALGRLADANPVVEFLITEDLTNARVLATQMEGLNTQRRLLTDQVYQAALSQIDRDPTLLDEAVLVLSHPSWPGGVIGIVASRLVERYRRPTVLFSTPSGEMARGSARSVEGCNITAAIAAHGEMLAGFGGHPMAAGLSMEPEPAPVEARIARFRRSLSRTVREMLGDTKTVSSLRIDGYLPLADLSLELVEDLERMAPFGPGNPALTLASKGLTLKSYSTVGRNDEHLQLIVEDEQGTTRKVIWWQGGESVTATQSELPQGRFDLAYTVRTSNYRSQREIEIEWIDARPLEETAISLKAQARVIEVVDYRGQPLPLAILEKLQSQGEVQVWCEGEARRLIPSHTRYELEPCRALAVWTTPPDQQVFQAALEKTSPEIIYLFGIDPGTDALDAFLRRLTGLAKYALRSNQGQLTISALAAATAQREATVRKGLAWLAARGHLTIQSEQGDAIILEKGIQQAASDLGEITQWLKALLDESNAYRVHFARADKEALI